MSQQISLKEAEKKAFRATLNDGLWDIALGCIFLMFVIAPLLSTRLGDFWSSAVFVPFLVLIYLAIWQIRKHVITPRIGTVTFGRVRKGKLKKFTIVMLVINIAAFILGLVAAMNVGRISGRMISTLFGLFLLFGFSLAAYFLDFSRLYLYGLLVGFSPMVGEWLWAHGRASHHGFPITFGTSAGIMILVGLILFARLLRGNPVPAEGIPSEESCNG
jgi:MFS family permease